MATQCHVKCVIVRLVHSTDHISFRITALKLALLFLLHPYHVTCDVKFVSAKTKKVDSLSITTHIDNPLFSKLFIQLMYIMFSLSIISTKIFSGFLLLLWWLLRTLLSLKPQGCVMFESLSLCRVVIRAV